MTPDELAAIERRAEAATPGPWSAANEHANFGPEVSAAWCVSRVGEPSAKRPDGWMYDIAEVYCDDRDHSADAAFIAHARADVPALIATVRALRAEVATLRREALLRDAGITTTTTAERA